MIHRVKNHHNFSLAKDNKKQTENLSRTGRQKIPPKVWQQSGDLFELNANLKIGTENIRMVFIK